MNIPITGYQVAPHILIQPDDQYESQLHWALLIENKSYDIGFNMEGTACTYALTFSDQGIEREMTKDEIRQLLYKVPIGYDKWRYIVAQDGTP